MEKTVFIWFNTVLTVQKLHKLSTKTLYPKYIWFSTEVALNKSTSPHMFFLSVLSAYAPIFTIVNPNPACFSYCSFKCNIDEGAEVWV